MEKEKLDHFDKFAHDYKAILDKSLELGGEKGEYFSIYKADLISRCVGSKFFGKILDYGCSIGLLSEVLLKQFPMASIDGLDVSSASIEHVPGHLKNQGIFTTDIYSLRQEYDLIVVANVLHHIEAPDREAVIAKLKTLLKNDGKIFIFEHNPLNPVTCKIVRDSPLDRGVVLLPYWETLSYLKTSGFEDRQIRYIVFFPKVLSFLRWAEPFLSWFPIGAQYVAIGQVKKHA